MHLNPLPPDLGDILKRFERVIIPELNLGQLTSLIRSKYLVDAKCLSNMQGLPFKSREIEAAIDEALASIANSNGATS